MNIGWNIETLILISGGSLSALGSFFIIKKNWRQYGLLYIISGIVGELLCLFFIKTGLYSFPYVIFPWLAPMPVFLVLTMFPFYIVFGVRYSPKSWPYKIPFYWAMVHIGMTLEVLSQNFTQVIEYNHYWDTWDSYTWWWIFFLVFELLGGAIVSREYRKPIDEELLRFGKVGWYITHFVFIATIFLAGFYMGIKVSR